MKSYELTVGGKAYKVDIEQFDGRRGLVKVDGRPYEIELQATPEAATAPEFSPARTREAVPLAPESPAAPGTTVPGGGEVVAPMPGMILEIMVSVGDLVQVGTPVIKMEAMKMENEIPAPVEGSVKEIRVKVGDNVSTDDVMMVIA